MVAATMAAQLPASNPTRVPLQNTQASRPRALADQAMAFDPGPKQVLAPQPRVQPAQPARGLIQMPAPEAFGLGHGAAESQEINWTLVRKQLRDLGVRSFQHEELPGGKHRMVCQLQNPSGQAFLVEAQGLTEKEAVENCLAKARGGATAR